MPQERYDVAIAGGGITGLTAALHARAAGLRVVLLEAAPRVGGVIATTTEDGFVAEHGPNSLQRTPALDRLVRQLGLGDEVVTAGAAGHRRYIVRRGVPRAIPSSLLGAIRTPLLSPGGKLRLFAEPWIGRRSNADESVAAFVRRRLGAEALTWLVDPFVAGVYAGDPERLGMAHAFPRLHALEREHGSLVRGMLHRARARRAGRTADGGGTPAGSPDVVSLRDGLATLPRAMAARLADVVRTVTPLQAARRTTDGWRLAVGPLGRTRELEARSLVWAGSAHAAMLVEWPAELRAHVDAMAALRYTPVASLTLGFRREHVRHPLDGFGMLVPAREPYSILGALFTSSLFPRRAPDGHVTITCFLGGDRRPELGTAHEAHAVALALADLRALLGVRGQPVWSRHVTWARAIPQYETTHGRVRDAAAAMERATPGLFVAGQPVDGVALGDCIAAGERAAERVQQWLATQPAPVRGDVMAEAVSADTMATIGDPPAARR